MSRFQSTMIPVRVLLFATAAIALREAGEAGESTANSIGERKSKAKDVVASLKKTEYGDSKAFTLLMEYIVPPENVEAFDKLAEATSEGYRQKEDGVFLFHAFKSETEPSKIAIAQVFGHQDSFFSHMKNSFYQKWEAGLKDLGAEVVKAKFLGSPEFSEERKQEFAKDKAEFWEQTVGFARAPNHKKVHGSTFLIESSFNVPNDNLPTINTLNTAFIASQFDWDPTCFFARICLDPDHDGEDTKFSYGGVYLQGRRPWSRAVELGEGKTEQNWMSTSMQYGVQLLEQHIYGNVSSKFKDLSKKFGSNITTYWDFVYGYDRYKTDRFSDDD